MELKKGEKYIVVKNDKIFYNQKVGKIIEVIDIKMIGNKQNTYIFMDDTGTQQYLSNFWIREKEVVLVPLTPAAKVLYGL